MSDEGRPTPPSDERQRGTWSRVGGRRLWVSAVVIVVVLLGLVAATTPTGRDRAAAPSTVAPGRTTLHAPDDLYVSGLSNGSVLLSWKPSHPAPVGYRVYRSSGHFGPYSIIGTVNAPTMDTFTDDKGLVSGVTYAYTVTAFDRQSESIPAGPIIAVLMPPTGPTPTPALPTPLPTFAPLTAPTLTALARMPTPVGTPGALSHPSSGAGLPATTATGPTASATALPSPGVTATRQP